MIVDVLASIALIVGCSLALVAGIGLMRFPDVLTRMHGATKPQTLGMVLVLIAIGLRADDRSAIAILVLVGLFALMTAPVSAHMLGRAAFRTGRVDRSALSRDDLA